MQTYPAGRESSFFCCIRTLINAINKRVSWVDPTWGGEGGGGGAPWDGDC